MQEQVARKMCMTADLLHDAVGEIHAAVKDFAQVEEESKLAAVVCSAVQFDRLQVRNHEM